MSFFNWQSSQVSVVLLLILCRKLFFVENFLFAFINNFGDSYKILSLFTSKYDKMLTTVQKRECQKPNNHAIHGHNSKKIYFLDILYHQYCENSKCSSISIDLSVIFYFTRRELMGRNQKELSCHIFYNDLQYFYI